jgi:gas vesicle protein
MADRVANRNTAAALLAGALMGAGVALLFAPQSGRQTRRDIRRFAERAGSKADAARIELQRTINNIVGDLEEKLQEGLARGIDWTDGKLGDLRRSMETIRKSVSGEIEKIMGA